MYRVLIVDDSSSARMLIRRCMEIGGIEVEKFFEAGNGKEALAVLSDQSADIVVTDLNMPFMDGRSLLKWIKNSPKLSSMPVVVISGTSNEAIREDLLGLGANSVLNKPISPSLLAETINPLLKKG